jgi:hypothetical protein
VKQLTLSRLAYKLQERILLAAALSAIPLHALADRYGINEGSDPIENQLTIGSALFILAVVVFLFGVKYVAVFLLVWLGPFVIAVLLAEGIIVIIWSGLGFLVAMLITPKIVDLLSNRGSNSGNNAGTK